MFVPSTFGIKGGHVSENNCKSTIDPDYGPSIPELVNKSKSYTVTKVYI
jgi:hypothetical protein